MEKQVISIIERVTGEVYPDANENSNVILDFGLDSLSNGYIVFKFRR